MSLAGVQQEAGGNVISCDETSASMVLSKLTDSFRGGPRGAHSLALNSAADIVLLLIWAEGRASAGLPHVFLMGR